MQLERSVVISQVYLVRAGGAVNADTVTADGVSPVKLDMRVGRIVEVKKVCYWLLVCMSGLFSRDRGDVCLFLKMW